MSGSATIEFMTESAHGLPERAINVLAVEDQYAYHIVYDKVFDDPEHFIWYHGWITHSEALAGELPGGSTWADYDVVLLDLGARTDATKPDGTAANPGESDEWPGLAVASRIRELTGATVPRRPFVAAVTNYSRHPGLMERARAEGTLDGWYPKDRAMGDDGDYLRGIVYRGYIGERFDPSGDVVPRPPHEPDFEKDLAKWVRDPVGDNGPTDVFAALKDGISQMELSKVTLMEYISPPPTWSANKRREILAPITEKVARHFMRKTILNKSSDQAKRWAIDYRGVRQLYIRYYVHPDRHLPGL